MMSSPEYLKQESQTKYHGITLRGQDVWTSMKGLEPKCITFGNTGAYNATWKVNQLHYYLQHEHEMNIVNGCQKANVSGTQSQKNLPWHN